MNLKPYHCIFAACSAVENQTSQTSQTPQTSQTWFQTTPPYGEYPGGDSVRDEKGKPIEGAVVVFDEASTNSIITAFNAQAATPGWPGILVDQEHFSLDYDKPSTALAWAKEIRREADGSLWTRWEFTEKGEKLYKGKMLINRSPVLRLEKISDKRFAPAELQSIGMTNTPHFKELSPLAAAKDNNNPKGNTDMDPEILAALGLQPEAGKEEVLAAIQQLKDKEAAAAAKCGECEEKCTEAEKKRDEAVAECRGMKADAFIAKHAEQIADAAKFREIYLANPDLAEQTLAVCKGSAAAAPSAAPATRIVAKDAKTPAATAGGATDAKLVARNNAVNAYMTAHKCSFTAAWNACRQADPENFAD